MNGIRFFDAPGTDTISEAVARACYCYVPYCYSLANDFSVVRTILYWYL